VCAWVPVDNLFFFLFSVCFNPICLCASLLPTSPLFSHYYVCLFCYAVVSISFCFFLSFLFLSILFAFPPLFLLLCPPLSSLLCLFIFFCCCYILFYLVLFTVFFNPVCLCTSLLPIISVYFVFSLFFSVSFNPICLCLSLPPVISPSFLPIMFILFCCCLILFFSAFFFFFFFFLF